MRNYFLSIVSVCILTAISFAQDFTIPKQTITGAETPIPLGELVILKPSSFEKTPNLEKVTYTWLVFEIDKKGQIVEKSRVDQDDKGKLSFGAGIKNKKLKVYLIPTYHFVVKEKDVITKTDSITSKLVVDVQLGEDAPNPNPEPEPDPDVPTPPKPNPPAPDSSEKFSAALPVWENAMKITDKNNRIKGATVLSKSYNGVASQIAAGTLKTPEKILAELADSNRRMLDDEKVSRDAWDNWSKFASEFTFKLYEDNKLNSDSDYAQLFREISRGLSYVK